MAMLRGDTFGVKLHAVDWERRVAEAHDVTVIGCCIDDQTIGDIFDNEAVIARRGKRRGKAGKEPAAVMRHRRGFAMHQPAAHYLAAEMLADGLVPEAYTQ